MLSLYVQTEICFDFTGGTMVYKAKFVSLVFLEELASSRCFQVLTSARSIPKDGGNEWRITFQNYIAKNVSVSTQRCWNALVLRSLEYFFSVGEGNRARDAKPLT